MTRTLEDFLQMSGRAGRRDDFRASCLLFVDKKTRDMEKCCDHYRRQNIACRRQVLAGYFEGNDLVPHNNRQNFGCCDICHPSLIEEDKFLRSLVEDRKSDSSFSEGLAVCRRTTSRDREDFKAALLYQQRYYMQEMPFLDMEITDGIVNLLVENLNRLKSTVDLIKLVPLLDEIIVEDIMEIIRDIFEKEQL
ncbi:hypothetical protein ACHWQZ_G002603 [Mnemiopsis leidyi]